MKPSHNIHQQPTSRSGFTLVELMVSVSLVVIILLMFAQVFQIATNTMSTQKGITTNDLRSRTLTTIIRNDIKMRTFRDIVPFHSNHLTAGYPAGVLPNRVGYWEIDEGVATDPTDDVLQFTALSTNSPIPDQAPFFGRATTLKPSAGNAADFDTAQERLNYLFGDSTTTPQGPHENQPEFDDGVRSLTQSSALNETAVSEAAEICYFLRNGILYRRVLLIRQRYDSASSNNQQPDELPVNENYTSNHVAGFGTTGVSGLGYFWHDFDFSAFYRYGTENRPTFHSWRVSGKNENPPTSTVADSGGTVTYPLSLGVPHLRFGHSLAEGSGIPRDEVTDGTFIGRFTQEETSDVDFLYPGRIRSGGDPHASTTALTLNNGTVAEFATSQLRRGEDILLTNVHEFDIKILDDGLSPAAFVDLGHGGGGHYGAPSNSTSGYGNRYDTWHPAIDASSDNTLVPPFRPTTNGADGEPGVINVDDDNINGTDDPGEQGYPGSDDVTHSLKAIQITIRFLDKDSGLMRQLTIVEPLVDN